MEWTLSPSQVMALARALLLTIQSHALLSVAEFCEKYPQRDGETGQARLEDVLRYDPQCSKNYCRLIFYVPIHSACFYIRRYKCAYAMREHCLRSNNKISKVFGVSYFQWTKSWPDIRQETIELVERTVDSGSTISSEEMKVFLDLYENSISLVGGESGGSGSCCSSSGYASIVWAVDFNAALRERQLMRAAEASMRPTFVVGPSGEDTCDQGEDKDKDGEVGKS